MLSRRNRFFVIYNSPSSFDIPVFLFYYIKFVFKDIRHIILLKLILILRRWTPEVVIFAVPQHVAVGLLLFSPLSLRWVSSVFLIPSQCSLSPPPPLLSEKKVGWDDGGVGRRRDGETECLEVHGRRQALLTPVTIPPSSLFSSPKSPVYLSASYIPNDWFTCFKWTVDLEVEFLESSLFTRAHTGAPPSLQIFTLCLSSFFFSYTTIQCQFLFPRQPLHQSLMVLPPRVLLVMWRSTESALFRLFCVWYWRWRDSHDWKLISNTLSPNRASRDALRDWNWDSE